MTIFQNIQQTLMKSLPPQPGHDLYICG